MLIGSVLAYTCVQAGRTQAADVERPLADEGTPAVIHPEIWPTVAAALPADPALEARIDALLARMSLERKVGQLIQADIASITPEDLRHYPLGSILNGGNSSPGNNEFSPPSEWLALADRFYDASVDPAQGPDRIPTVWGTDAVHGHNNLVGATLFPHNIGLGASRDPQLIRRIAAITASEVRATGLDWTFGPTLAVVRDKRWGRTYESYSEDPRIVAEYSAQMVLGLQGEPGTADFLDASHVIATAKHFVGDGGTGGRDQGDNRSSETELRDVDFAGYPPAVGAGVQTVMASFSSWRGGKIHGHYGLLTQVLKERLHFDGLVVGDWNAHGQIPGCTTTSCPAALVAGLDVFMAPDSWKLLYDNTLAQARSGAIPAARLDDAVRRVLRVKLRAHVLDEPRPSSRPLAGHFELLGSPDHRAVARRAVRESLVLLKNRRHLLPLNPRHRVLVAGDGADNIGKQSGGWTITWQGTGVANRDFPNGESIYAGIASAVSAAGGSAELSPTGSFTARPDVAIVVFGENPYAEFQGDLGTLEYSPGEKSDLKLLRRLRAQRIPVVAVFLSGRPLWVNPEINASDAFVAAWLPGTEGGGIADVLFRAADGTVAHDFHGKLSFSWPRTPQQTASDAVGKQGAPLFAFGYGLTYADDGNLRRLPEDTGTNAAAATDSRHYFAAGRPGSGWQWLVREGQDSKELPGGVGMSSTGLLRLTATDHDAQEDARRFQWSGTAAASVGLNTRTGIDLRRESNGQLSLGFDYKVIHAPAGKVELRVECGPECAGAVDVTSLLAAAPPAAWSHAKVPLQCFAKAGADMGRVLAPFVMSTAGALDVSVSNIRLETGTDGVLVCPQ